MIFYNELFTSQRWWSVKRLQAFKLFFLYRIAQFEANELLVSPSLAKCVDDALCQLSDSYSKTLEGGRRLCEDAAEPESQRDVQSELQSVQEDWERCSSLLQQRRDLERTVVKVEATHRPITTCYCFFLKFKLHFGKENQFWSVKW